MCYTVGCSKAYVPKLFLSFQLFQANEGLEVFALRFSGIGMIIFIMLDGWKGIQTVKLAYSVCIQSLKSVSYLAH